MAMLAGVLASTMSWPSLVDPVQGVAVGELMADPVFPVHTGVIAPPGLVACLMVTVLMVTVTLEVL